MSEHERHLCETCLQAEYEDFQHSCIHESMAQNEVWREKYRIGSWPRWDYSMEDATLVFSDQGRAKVICNIEVVGSTNPESWEWAWGNEYLPLACRNAWKRFTASAKKDTGTDSLRSFSKAASTLVGNAPRFASHILGGMAVYRCPSSDGGADDAVYIVILSAKFVN